MVNITINGIELEGDLKIPKGAKTLVLFAHGSGSSRLSPRNRAVAEALNKNKLATLLIDLLTKDEEEIDDQTQVFRFDIDLLATRLIMLIDYLAKEEKTKGLNIVLFGASTGAAAALIAAAQRSDKICSVVSRGGRPDLAKEALEKVKSPTLLIVGERDEVVIELNEQAAGQLSCEKKLVVVPKATHLFQEKGALEEVARLAAEWFLNH